MTAEPTRVVIITSAVEPAFEDRFATWLVHDRVVSANQVPAVTRATAYAAVEGEPRFMVCYELAPGASDAKALLEPSLTEMPAEFSRHVSEQAAVYEQVFPREGFCQGPAWSAGQEPGGVLVYRMSVAADVEEAFNDWYNRLHIPALCGVPGTISARRFRALQGSPLYMAWYELVRPDVPASEAWHEAVAATRSELPTSERWRTIYEPLSSGETTESRILRGDSRTSVPGS
jgi:hypothetical protein